MGANQSSNLQRKEEYTEWRENFQKQYDGHHHWSAGIRSRRPKLSPAQLEARMSEMQNLHEERAYRKRRYLNPWGENEHGKYPDLDVYYSTTKGFPRRLVVQATDDALNDSLNDSRPRHWGHRKLEGNLPSVIWLSEFCLNPFGLDRYDGSYVDEDEEAERKKNEKKNVPRDILMTVIVKPLHWITSTVLTLFLAWIIQVLVSVKIIASPWTDGNSTEPYEDYENVHWDWPKHAMNILDQSPDNPNPQSTITKLTIPRLLVVWNPDKGEKGEWETKETAKLRDEKTGMLPPYIFLSFSRSNYPADDDVLKPFFYSIVQSILDNENANRDPKEPRVEAFWVDTNCVSHASPAEHTRDVNTICDAVRCAKRVYILLPNDKPKEKRSWGKRIWTLPEVLLAADRIRYCITPSWEIDQAVPNVFRDVSLTDMYQSFWPQLPAVHQASAGEGHGERHEDAICHLIDHYTNRTKLSDLQLFTFVIQALAQLTTGPDIEGHTTTSMAYAAMGLMSYRLTPDESDSTFQAIARLSLVNDSNQLLERLLCLWPYPAEQPPSPGGEKSQASANSIALLRNIADQDQYATHLWNIQPLCDVVGIGNDEGTPTVIMDRCRGIPIRWKNFPRMKYVTDMSGFRATMSQFVVYLGAWFLLAGVHLFGTVATLGFATLGTGQGTATNQSSFDEENVKYALLAVASFFVIGWVISWFSPRAVRQLCNGGTKGVSRHLVGFEGTLPMKKIEKVMYGNYQNRLSYEASTTPFSENLRDLKYRVGVEPKDPKFWDEERIRLKVPSTHRLFTIVNTGSMTVSVISAERPPVVALICGREGGMLRTLLCSWRFETNTLYREGVMRVSSSLERMAIPNDWLKISLASQGDVSRMRKTYQT